jgi:hypothetical protein
MCPRLPKSPSTPSAYATQVRRDYWYYTGSTGWFDRDFTWSPVYDAAGKCGRPLAPAARPAAKVYTREYERCHVMLNCTTVSQNWPQLGCEGAILPVRGEAHAPSPSSEIPLRSPFAVEAMA